MVAPFASSIHIINTPLFNWDVSSKSFSKVSAVVQYVSANVSRIIRREAVRASSIIKYDDSYIKLARANNDLDVLQLLSLLVSVFIESTECGNPHKLCVVFDQICPLLTNKKNIF